MGKMSDLHIKLHQHFSEDEINLLLGIKKLDREINDNIDLLRMYSVLLQERATDSNRISVSLSNNGANDLRTAILVILDFINHVFPQ